MASTLNDSPAQPSVMPSAPCDVERSSRWGIGLAGVAFVYLVWPTLATLAEIYANDDDYSHGFLVPFFSLYALIEIRRDCPREADVRSPFWALGVLALGVSCLLVGQWYDLALAPDGMGVGCLGAVGIILSLAGLCAANGGLAAIRQYAFPLGFLAFAVPLPWSLTRQLTAVLRQFVSAASEPLIRLLGITVYREGNIIHLANASLGVEDACSGIRSLTVLLAAAAALVYVRRIVLRRAVILIVAAVPIAVVANLGRVVVTAGLVQWRGIIYTQGWRHEVLGWGVFVVGLAMLMVVAHLLQTSARQPERAERLERGVSVFALRPTIGVLSILVGAAFVVGIVRLHYSRMPLPPAPERAALAAFPTTIGSFVMAEELMLAQAHEDLLRPSEYIMRRYRNGREEVELRVMFWDPMRDRRGRVGPRYHSPDSCYPSWGYVRQHEFDGVLPMVEIDGTVQCRVFRKSNTRHHVLFWERQRRMRAVPDSLRGKLTTLVWSWNEPFFDFGYQYLVTIVTAVDTTPDVSRQRAVRFARLVGPLLPEFGIGLVDGSTAVMD